MRCADVPVLGFCILDGYNVPFDAARIAARSIALVRDRFWLVPDAISVIEKAARARVP